MMPRPSAYTFPLDFIAYTSGRSIVYSEVITDHDEAGTVLDAGKTKRNRVYSTLKEFKFQEEKQINKDKF